MSMPASTTQPTLRQLDLLLALAGSTGVASAGAKLGMSPSATSHALRALETALGASLVDRNVAGLGLTHTGNMLMPHVRDLFASLQQIQAIAMAGAALEDGMLRIGSFGASATTRVLPRFIESFQAIYPGIKVVVIEKPADQTLRDLAERRLELAAMPLPVLHEDCEILRLAIDDLVAVLPASHRFAESDSISLEQIASEPFIMTRAGSQALVTRLFKRNGLKPNIASELLQILSILEMIKLGKGVSLLARLALPDQYEGVIYRSVFPSSSRRIGLVCLDSRRLSPASKAFWEIVDRTKFRPDHTE